MLKDKTDNDQRLKTLRVVKTDNPPHYEGLYNQEELAADPDYEYDYNKFLWELFNAIDELGPIIPFYLENNWTHFSTTSNWGEIIENNIIRFGDNFDPNNSAQEMNFDEFLKIEHQYQILCRSMPDEIIFKRIGKKVTLEGIWHKKQ